MTPDQARAWLILEGWAFIKTRSWFGVIKGEVCVWQYAHEARIRHSPARSVDVPNTDVLPPAYYAKAMRYILELGL